MAYNKLSTANLPDPGIDPAQDKLPAKYFDTFLYTGNGSGLQVGDVIKKPADTTDITNSLIFNDNDSAYLSRTPASAGNRKTWTWSGWVKRGNLSASGATPGQGLFTAYSANTAEGLVEFYIVNDGLRVQFWGNGIYTPNNAFKDTSYWHHVLLAVDTTQSTGSDRVKIWVDGVQQSLTFGLTPALNLNTAVNNTVGHSVGSGQPYTSHYLDGYLAEVHFVDGTAHEPTDFGNFDANGYWIPKEVTGITYGTNGFYLDFSDGTSTTTLGEDQSGEGNDWTLDNMATTDQVDDSPTDNFAVIDAALANGTLSEGNLKLVTPSSGYSSCKATIPMRTGKWYWEVTQSSQSYISLGIVTRSHENTINVGGGASTPSGHGYGFYATETNIDGVRTSSVVTNISTATTIAFAYDADTRELKLYLDGTLEHTDTVPYSDDGPYYPAFGDFGGAASATMEVNFGQKTFTQTAPTGYLALSENNITVDDQNLESPDLVWIKTTSNAYHHAVADSIRGVTSQLSTSSTNAESTQAGSGVISFNKNGFTLGTESAGTGSTNSAGIDYVAWCWKANGATGVSNTDGSITSTVSANTTSGFSIVSYTGNGTTGATVGHGLDQAPDVVIQKNRSRTTTLWRIDHFPADAELYFDTGSNQNNYWNNSISNTVITLNKSDSTYQNYNGDNYIAYCFHSVDGFSKFGSYTGNGSTSGAGPFVYTGFRPAFVIYKNSTDAGTSWQIFDSKRLPYNSSAYNILNAEANSAEATGTTTYGILHMYSNGFQLKYSGNDSNGSGDTFIYMAFAETPFKYATAR